MLPVPCSIEAEINILGMILLDKSYIIKLQEKKITDTDFYYAKHQVIFKAIQNLFNRNEAIDPVTVYYEVQKMGLSQNIEPKDVLDLSDSINSFGMFDSYLNILQDKAFRRNVIAMCSKIQELAYNLEKNQSEIREVAEQEIYKLNTSDTVDSLENMSEIFKKKQEEALRVGAEGYKPELDNTKKIKYKSMFDILKGFKAGQLILIGGRPAMGKSAFGVDLAVDYAKRHNEAIAIFSLEMDKESIADRILASEFGQNSYNLKINGVKGNDVDRFNEIIKDLSSRNIYIDDKSCNSVTDIKNAVRKLKTKLATQGIKLGLVLVDYLQLCDSEGENRQTEISKISRGLKQLARSFQLPVLALSQLSRKVEERANKRPMLSDLRESGAIEQDSDVVLFIYRDEYYNPSTAKSKVAEIIVAKQRGGSTGTVELFFDSALTTFKDMEFK